MIAMLHTKHSVHPSDDKARAASRQLDRRRKKATDDGCALHHIPFRISHLNIEIARRLIKTPRANR